MTVFIFGILLFALFIWLFLYLKKRLNNKVSTTSIDHLFSNSQEDPERLASTRRVKNAFMDQAESMQARASKPHDPTCQDTWICIKDPCFMTEGDRIVSTSVELLKTKEERRRSRPSSPAASSDLRKS